MIGIVDSSRIRRAIAIPSSGLQLEIEDDQIDHFIREHRAHGPSVGDGRDPEAVLAEIVGHQLRIVGSSSIAST
jgi:hypothetical protein